MKIDDDVKDIFELGITLFLGISIFTTIMTFIYGWFMFPNLVLLATAVWFIMTFSSGVIITLLVTSFMFMIKRFSGVKNEEEK